MAKSKLPAIPRARFQSADQQKQADAVQALAETLAGRKGNGMDRAVLVRDLSDAGLVHLKKFAGGGVDIGGGKIPDGMEDEVIALPPTPTGFAVSGAFTSIALLWNQPAYRPASASAHTEIWRNTVDNLTEATLIATTVATVYGDVVGTGSTFYYWIRHVNVGKLGTAKYGPYNAVDGTLAATSPDISNVIDDVAEQMRDSPLINDLQGGIDGVAVGVEQNSQAITTLDEEGSAAHQALWNAKAQAGDIKAGIGLLAKSDGTSQVAVAASQFFVFDPNAPGKLTPTFAIDKGNVVIPKALIETATIQVLNAQTITADKVVSGISISSPVIDGGSVTGGWAGFGKGGRFNGYHTLIHSNGTVQTEKLNMSSSGGNSRLEIVGDQLNVFENGNLRVRIGRL